jgi:hypothetical protein
VGSLCDDWREFTLHGTRTALITETRDSNEPVLAEDDGMQCAAPEVKALQAMA